MFPYQRLRHQDEYYGLEEGGGHVGFGYDERARIVKNVKPRSWYRPSFRGVQIRRRRFRVKVPRLRRLILRKKFRVVSAFRVSCAKLMRRLKESQNHFGDFFAGNYLFLQINPASMKRIQESWQANQVKLQGMPSGFSLSRVA
ncbi:uncharacterized protein LOC123222317 [Mangifera indica]|uniref:uncharacterized protein LOC123222317 n=1 Tax=Mangifera indica TaxID=29780 RepID=UPI001CFA1844|nr:uncharacterized protein LOC123222317 [Mangifera indica]